jgi:hypothetical protein
MADAHDLTSLSPRRQLSARAGTLEIETTVEQAQGGHVIRVPLFHKGLNPTVEEKFGRPALFVSPEDWAATLADFEGRTNDIEVDLEHVLIDPEVPPRFRVGSGKLLSLHEDDGAVPHYYARALVDDETFDLVATKKKKNASPVYFLKKDAEGREHPVGLHSVALTSSASIDRLPLVAAASIRAGLKLQEEETNMADPNVEKLEKELAETKGLVTQLQEKLTSSLAAVADQVKGLVESGKAAAEAAAKTVAEATDKAFTEVVAEARSAGKVRKGDETFEIAARAILKEKGLEVLRSHVKAMPVVAPPDGTHDSTKTTPKSATRSKFDTIGEIGARSTLKPEVMLRHNAVVAYAEDQEKAGRKIDYVTALREFGAAERAGASA